MYFCLKTWGRVPHWLYIQLQCSSTGLKSWTRTYGCIYVFLLDKWYVHYLYIDNFHLHRHTQSIIFSCFCHVSTKKTILNVTNFWGCRGGRAERPWGGDRGLKHRLLQTCPRKNWDSEIYESETWTIDWKQNIGFWGGLPYCLLSVSDCWVTWFRELALNLWNGLTNLQTTPQVLNLRLCWQIPTKPFTDASWYFSSSHVGDAKKLQGIPGEVISTHQEQHGTASGKPELKQLWIVPSVALKPVGMVEPLVSS